MIKHRLIVIAQASATQMKTLAVLTPVTVVFLPGSAQAGEAVVTDSKNVAPAPPPPEVFGTGFYMGLDLGANVWQDRGDTRVFNNEFGDTLTIDPNNDVGFYGGLKAGY